jgi:DNA-binding MarR family transcriptional regulator
VKSPSPPPSSARTRVAPRAPYLIKELERALRTRIDALVESLGLTAVQYTALSVLSGHRGMTSAQLARRSFVSPQAANEMVAGLERRGLIRRKADREGGRALWIFPTALGERTLARCDELVDALEDQMFHEVSRQDEDRFRRLLRMCRDALRPSDEEALPARRASLKTVT